MRKRYHILLLSAFCASAQTFDLVLAGGHVIDPANGIDRVMDVAVQGNRIAAVSERLPSAQAHRVVDARGLYVTPGLIDLHTHVYIRGRSATVLPDDAVLSQGTTTVVDAGVAGWRNFDDFKASVIDQSRTRVLALLNIVGGGMNDDQRREDNVEDMDPAAVAAKIRAHPRLLVGVKTAHFGLYGWTAVERALQAGRLAGVPVMLDSSVYTNTGRHTRHKVLELMRPGDIHTHTYNDHQVELLDRFTGRIQPWMVEARQRGVLFDLGHGGGSFLWPIAAAALRQGFPPDTISTDLHTGSILTLRVSMTNAISKLLNLGMSLQDAILRSTVNPAKAIRRFPELGTLSPGAAADIGLFQLETGVFAFVDSQRRKLTGTRNLRCVATIRDGAVVYLRPAAPPGAAQAVYDLVLRNGAVVDPAAGRNGRFDIGIEAGRIARIAPRIPLRHGRLAVDLSDYSVTPGLIDTGASVNFLDSNTAVQADHHSLPHGVTTVLDGAATPGVIRRSRTQILAVPVPRLDSLVASRLTRQTALDRSATMTAALSRAIQSGLSFEKAIEGATLVPARAAGRADLGTLRENGPADLAAFEVRDGEVVCVLTLRNGQVVWDLHGLTFREWTHAGPYSMFR